MKYNRRRTLIPLAVLLIGLFYFGFRFYQEHTQPDKRITIVFIPKIQQNDSIDFWTTLTSGVEMAAEEFNVKLIIDAPATEIDYKTQNQLIEAAIEKHPDVLMVSPISSTKSAASIQKVKDAGIPVVFIDSTANGVTCDCTVATDNFAAGAQMGEFTKTLLDENSKIAIVSHVKNSSTAIDREYGFRSALKNEEDKIIDVVYSDSDFHKAYVETKELLTEHPDITILAGLNEYSAIGAGNALKDLKLSDKVSIIGFDNSIAAVSFLEEGVFEGLVIQNSFNMGYLGTEAACKIANGETVKAFINSGSELITRDNMYTTESQKLLFSFLN